MAIFLLMLLIIVLFTYITLKINDKFGLKRHKSILDSTGFKTLLQRGFTIEKVNDYSGIFGSHQGYLCDIYYDWAAGSKKCLVLNIYFTPKKELHPIHCANYDFIVLMIKKYCPMWHFKSYSFSWYEGSLTMFNSIGFRNPTYGQIVKKLEIAVKILKQENLMPINKEDLDFIRENFPFQSTPSIELYRSKKNYKLVE
jgi:hypothetical protein